MAKGSSNKMRYINRHNSKKNNNTNSDYIYHMSCSTRIDESAHWFQLLPIIIFSAVIIMITRMAIYDRPMDKFFWGGGQNQLIDFFSYYKMVAIIICAVLAIILLLYRLFSQSFSIRKSYAYIPMAVYSVFVLLSYLFSEYKGFSLLGYNDRFEGTIPVLGYMVILFYIINTIHTEHDVKMVVYPIAATSSILGLIGLTQALDHDIFRTNFGKQLITPSWFWDRLDQLNFTFQDREIYQTVYNINYVSFYLTLLIPLFGLLFIRSMLMGKEEAIWKKFLWGALFTLLIYNLIGSASSGGLLGFAVIVLVGIILLNKRIVKWWKPVVILLCLTVAVAGISYDRWFSELTYAIGGVIGTRSSTETPQNVDSEPETAPVINNTTQKIDYMVTENDSIIVSVGGNQISFKTSFKDPLSIHATDSDGKELDLVLTEEMPKSKINDPRFSWLTIRPAQDETGDSNFYVLNINGTEWPFLLTEDGPKYFNGFKKAVDLRNVPSFGWENNQSFGNGRGYIWSRSIPMMKETILLGHGADTYCLYFPHDDYVGKYNSVSFTSNTHVVVDKPHNMYLGTTIGTGAISLLALLALWGIYIVQSFLLYRKEKYDSFAAFAGAGIFLGVCGFLTAAIVNDSSVSTMPIFYGLLGTGIAINSMPAIKKNTSANE